MHTRFPPILLVGIAVFALPLVAAAAPQLAFDTFDGGNKQTFRGPGSSPGSTIVVSEDVIITRISVLNDLLAAGELRFVVANKETGSVVHVSEPQLFADNGVSWKTSEPLEVVLEANVEYEIGAITNTIATWTYDEFATASGIYKSTGINPNFISFSNPHVASHGVADAAVRLYIDNPACGDGIVDIGEDCDDGNAANTDECPTTCATPYCGDGFTWYGEEQCDDANYLNIDACLNNCNLAACGDGYWWLGSEACDDGNLDNSDLCTNACESATCGDGFVQPGEACDDANSVDDDSCSNACVPDTCGNGLLQGAEECDDGNDDNSDSCTNNCTLPACGDGQVQAPEACDDGNPMNGDECLNTCALNTCGDGHVSPMSEQCDDANTIQDDACTNSCRLPTCGDGIVQGDEECDDGNDIDDADTCDNNCAQNTPDPGDGDTGDTGETGDGDTGETGDGDTGETGDGDAGETGDDETGGFLSGGLDDLIDDGCSCNSRNSAGGGLALGLLAALGLLSPLRRRRQ
jgi:cysteine-rich repeat protein